MFRQRLRLLLLIYFIAICFVIFRFFQIQILRGKTYTKSAVLSTLKQSSVTLLRGTITDRHGKTLARSTASYDLEIRVHAFKENEKIADLLAISPHEFSQKIQEIHQQVSQDEQDILDYKVSEKLLPGLLKQYKTTSKKELIRKIGKIQWDQLLENWKVQNPRTTKGMEYWAKQEAQQKYYPLIQNIPYDLACHLRIKNYEGVRIQAASSRLYENPTVAPHLLGRLGLLDKEEYEDKKFLGYLPIDRVGKSGIEKHYEDLLWGKRGFRLTEFDKTQLKRKIIFEDTLVGNDHVSLTLDFELQAWTESVLDSYQGKGPGLLACVIMRIEDGQVLVMATTPRYSLETFSEKYQELLKDPNRPLLNRAVQNHIVPNPGSVYKLLTAIAILEENLISSETTVECRGYLFNPKSFRCHIFGRGRHGQVTLEQALERSCNIFFYKYGEILGIEKLAYWSKRFGFGQKTYIEVDQESRGLIPTPEWKKKRYKNRPKEEQVWNVGETRLCSIGQKIETTPIQIARFICAIANGGYLVHPHLVHQPKQSYRDTEKLCSTATLKRVIDGMRLVVHGNHGTAQRYGLEKFGFIGKTGTADTKKGKEPHAWLAGYAPEENPKYAIVMVAEYAGHGGDVCGPLVQKVLLKLFDPTYSSPQTERMRRQ